LFVARPWTLSVVPELAREAARQGLNLSAFEAPLAESTLSRGKTLPRLAAFSDPEERLAAVGLGNRVIGEAQNLGASLLILDFGEVFTRPGRGAIARLFARAELEPDEAGTPQVTSWNALAADRKRQAEGLMEAAKRALDRLVPGAERAGVKLGLVPSDGPWGFPSPREAEDLLACYQGAPVAAVPDTSHWAVLVTLGLVAGPARLQSLLENAAAVIAAEAVGMSAGLLPGLGESDARALAKRAAAVPALPVIIDGKADSRDEEIALAAGFFEGG
jgi:hypothetical protein